jgi:hypothetical protein
MAKKLPSKKDQLIGNTVFNTSNWMCVALDAIPENYHKSILNGAIEITKPVIEKGFEDSVKFMKSNMEQLDYYDVDYLSVIQNARQKVLALINLIETDKNIPSNSSIKELYDELNRLENDLCY